MNSNDADNIRINEQCKNTKVTTLVVTTRILNIFTVIKSEILDQQQAIFL